MARTPSMTPQEAINLLGRERGSLPSSITPDQHKILRKWATASGLPGAYAATLKKWKLVHCYNLADAAEYGLEWHKRNAITKGITAPAPDDDESVEIAPPVTIMPPPAEHVQSAQSTDAGHALAALVAPYIGRTLTADVLARVNTILDQRLADITTTRIELTRTNGETITVEGHKHAKFETLLRAMSARMANGRHPNIMIVGPTGSGKTHGVEQATAALGKPFFSNGAISMDHQLIGFKDAGGNYHPTALRDAFGIGATYLFDEIDSSDNSPLLALAGALANSGFRFPDVFVDRHLDCNIIACANTWGLGGNADFVGRNKLDGAIRSRFPIRIYWDYDEKLERDICGNAEWAIRVQKARANARRAGLKVIIDPRMSQAGAALIASGLSFNDAASLTYLADLSDDQRRIVEAA